jgi:NtrC-family two-component system sensor histidine kinase KinB
MKHEPLMLKTFAPWLLGLVTVVILLLHLPSPIPDTNVDMVQYIQVMVFYGFLTAFALYFSVLLAEGTLSAAHTAGIIAFLSLPIEARGTTLWVIFFGSVAGSLAVIIRESRQPVGTPYSRRGNIATIVFTSARVTLSLFLASQIYLALGGPVELGTADAEMNPVNIITIAVFSLANLVIYFGIFMLQCYSEGRDLRRIVSESWREILIILAVPVPLAVLGAHIFNSLANPAFVILMIGLLLAIVGLHRLTNAQYLLRKQLDEVRTLSVIAQSMRSHLNLESLLKNIYLQVTTLLDIDSFVLALYNRDNRLQFPLIFKDGVEKRSVATNDDSQSTFDLRHTRYPLLMKVIDTQTSLLFSEHVIEEAAKMGIHISPPVPYSWMGVPLLAAGRTLGAIAVESSDLSQHFTPNHLRLLNIVAASASIAIENAQLYEQQTERVNHLATLNDISSSLTGSLSRDEVLKTLIDSASSIAGASAAAVYLFPDEAQWGLKLVQSGGLSEEFTKNPPEPLLRGSERQPLRQQLPVIIKNTGKDPRVTHLKSVMGKEGKAAWIELPMSTGTTDLGVLSLYYDTPQQFSNEIVEFLRTFATQASQALNNARLYSKTDEALVRRVDQLNALAALGRLLTATISIDKVGELVLDYATEATKSPVGVVMLYDSQSGSLQSIAQIGYASQTFEQPRTLIPDSAFERALKNGQAMLISDMRAEQGFKQAVSDMRSQLTVPVLRGTDAVGAITLEQEQVGAYSNEDVEFVSQIANQMVIALDNARLFEQISEALNRLQIILDAMEEAIVLIDQDGNIALANPRIDLIGLSPADLMTRNVKEIAHQSDLAQRMGFTSAQELLHIIEKISNTNGATKLEPVLYTVEAPLGTLHIRRQIIPIRDENDKAIGALLVFYNKTEEQELERAREDLSRMIVHDLRSPLTAVTTSLKLMREIIPANSEYKRTVQEITEASQRAIRKLLSRVDSLLDISKMESGELTLDTSPTELANLADSVCVELSPLAHELNIEINSQIPDALPLLMIDADKVERVLSNLVDNALKYTPANSVITIRAHMPDSKYMVRVEISDQGPGIPEEYKRRLFDRYVQIQGRRGARRGTGLGLTFCRLVVEAHNGLIWIEDNPIGGSIFAFTLPILKPDLLDGDDFTTELITPAS